MVLNYVCMNWYEFTNYFKLSIILASRTDLGLGETGEINIFANRWGGGGVVVLMCYKTKLCLEQERY